MNANDSHCSSGGGALSKRLNLVTYLQCCRYLQETYRDHSPMLETVPVERLADERSDVSKGPNQFPPTDKNIVGLA